MDKKKVSQMKKNGFMPQKQDGCYSMRLRIAGGQITAEHLHTAEKISTEYGKGYIHLTSRQSIEIPFIRDEDVDTVKELLRDAGLEPAAGGPKVRTITACQGSAVCKSGLIDTTELADVFNEKYYGKELPHKFKLGITGCRNNCLKAEENDLGVKGAMRPLWNENVCTYCGLCEKTCPAGAIAIDTKAHGFTFDESKCLYCGRCVKNCPFGAWDGENGFILYFGGLFGNRIQIGKQLVPILYTVEDVCKAVECTMDYFQENGKPGERFGNTLKRLGYSGLRKKIKDGLRT